MNPTPTTQDTNLPPFAGGRTVMVASAIAGVAGLALTFLGALASPGPVLTAYLISFVYWLGLALGALALLMANHTAGARWNVSVRRIGETMAAVVPLFLVLFIPLLLGARHVWFWIEPPAGLPAETMKALEWKHPYLNFGSFAVRGVAYFLIWTLLSWLLRGWSVRQDESGEAALTQKQRSLSAPGLLILALTATFASFDWLMTLQPTWYSTIFGLYIFIGAFVTSIALFCLIVTGLRSSNEPLGRLITVDQQHNLGKFLLAFVAFWAYMAFSQYMLIWAGNLPEELTWIIVRSRGVWRPVGQLILFGHFVVPFLILLSRDIKRSPRALAAVAMWIMVIHYVDLYWVVMPAGHPDHLGLHWTHLTSFVGIGGLSVAFGLYLFRAARPVPVRDPFLEDSLAYVQP